MSYAVSAIFNNGAYAEAATGIYSKKQKNPYLPAYSSQQNSNLNVNSQQNFLGMMTNLDQAVINSNVDLGFTNNGNGKIYADKEVGTITGDPHFKGGDGETYDVQGQAGKTYNLLNDKRLNYNGKFEAWGNGGATVVGESAINVSDFGEIQHSSVTFDKTGKAKHNGKEIKDGETVMLADGGTATKQGNKLIVKTMEGYEITQTAMPGGYINSEVKTGALGVGFDNQNPDGLLGQTFDEDKVAKNGKKGAGAQGEGTIHGKVQDYETTLNTSGDQKLDANGKPIREKDMFPDAVNVLSQFLAQQTHQDFSGALRFVMDTLMGMLGNGNGQRA